MESPPTPPNDNTPAVTLPGDATEKTAGQPPKAPQNGEKGNSLTPPPVGVQPKSPELTPVDTRKKELAEELDTLEGEVLVAAEWGIFKRSDAQHPANIYGILDEAQKALASGNLSGAETAIMRGREVLNQVESSSWVWGINNQFGFLPIIFTALSGLLTYKFVFRNFLDLEGTTLLHYAAFAGMIGAILRCLYWLQFQASQALFRPRWFTVFIVAPPIGAILGWFVSLLIKVSVQAVSKDPMTTDWRMISLVAAFAGFNWEWALGVLEETVKSLLARISDKSPAKTKS
jgi:hypothetical protein